MNHIKVINLRTPADSGQMKPLRFYDDPNQYETHICVVVSQFYFHMVELHENILVTVRVLHNVKRGYSNNSDVKYDFIVAKE